MNLEVLKNALIRITLSSCLLASVPAPALAQSGQEPERFQLLNGLRVLHWYRPGEEVMLKLRIHSGAAFDIAGKAGGMNLLGDILFPDSTTREYFVDEMQGRFGVSTNHDSITITMAGRAREFERIIEILRTGVVTPQLTPENFTRIREGRIKVIKDSSISATMVADRAIAARLFGDFPYGRPYAGTVESLGRVERTDLMLARERFLNPNNATLVVIGNVQTSRARRALRQLLGGWRMSERLVPATFRQPAPPDPRTLIVSAPGDQSVEVRVAVRSFARNDKDTPAAGLLEPIALKRWEKLLPELAKSPMSVRNDSFVLPGMFVMGATVDPLLAAKTLSTAKEVMRSLVTSPPTAAELEAARAEVILNLEKKVGTTDGQAEAWLDADTYGLSSADQVAPVVAISLSDLNRAANRLFRELSTAALVVGNPELVKTQLESIGKVELLGQIDPATSSQTDPGAAKPPSKSADKPE